MCRRLHAVALLCLLRAAAGIRQSPAELWLSPGATDQLGCNTSGAERSVSWYRERPDGALLHVYQSFQESPPQGRYSGTRERRRVFSFRISSVRREDSGVYYCSLSALRSGFGNGTRLVVSGEHPAESPGWLLAAALPGLGLLLCAQLALLIRWKRRTGAAAPAEPGRMEAPARRDPETEYAAVKHRP